MFSAALARPHRGWAALALGIALLASGCSSSGGKSGGGSSPPSASSTASGTVAGAAGVVVRTHSGPMGTFLTDASGKSLYMFASDTATKSSCSGPCVTYWPPLTTTGAVQASGQVTAGKLGTITRADGSKQVSYAGHPLYYFKLDTAPGDTNGQGSSNFGAKWWLLAPSGAPITSTGGSAPSSSSSSGGGGGGGWA